MKHLFLLLLSFITALIAFAQRPFENQINEYKQADKLAAPPQNAILFVGSSSIRLWDDLKTDFAGYPVINRGFGGSGIDHATMYADDIIIPYHPKQIVIYTGENDVAGGKVKATDMIYRFKTLYKKIRSSLPNTNIVYVSMKPSPSRAEFRQVIEESNKLIKEFLAKEKNTEYVDIYSLMLDSSGNPIPELYRNDSLHMTRKGYAIWTKAIKPVLMK